MATDAEIKQVSNDLQGSLDELGRRQQAFKADVLSLLFAIDKESLAANSRLANAVRLVKRWY